MTRKVVVVGGGAAGLMAALWAAEAGAETLLLEGTSQTGRKILISGGGRCNVLPSRLSPKQYRTASSPNTLKKILLSWPLTEQRHFFEKGLAIPLALEAESGKLFPVSNRAKDVRDALVEHAGQRGVRMVHEARVTGLERDGERWIVQAGGGRFDADAVVLATGGLSVPKTGSDGQGLRILERLGHTIHPLYPALTPLLAEPPVHAGMAGVSLDVTLDARSDVEQASAKGGFLFTHRGYSGPSVLDISHVQTRATESESVRITVAWTDRSEEHWRSALAEQSGRRVSSLLSADLPDRLVALLLGEAGIPADTSLSQLPRDARNRLVECLSRFPLPVTGDEGYRKAEVTGGGVSLAEVDPRTLESRVDPGLFLCGELLDAFGPIGGYNFAWAWSTGRAAGRAAAGSI